MTYKIETIENLQELEMFLLSSKYQNFMQTPIWAEFKINSGEHWKYKCVVLRYDEKIVGSAIIHIRDLPLISKKMWYIPRGFVTDYDNLEYIKVFCKELIEFGKKNNAAFIKIDPYVEAFGRNLEGELLDESQSYDNLHIVKLLEDSGFKHRGFGDDMKDLIQPRKTLTLDLTLSVDELYKCFNRKTQRGITCAIKNSVEVYEGNISDIPLFYQLMSLTASRSNFLIRNQEYFIKLYEILHKKDMVKLYFAKINTQVFLENSQSSYDNSLKLKWNLDKQMKKQKVSQKRYDEVEEMVNTALLKLDEAKKMFKDNPNGIILSSAIITYFGKTANYLFTGSTNEFKTVQAPYLMQWEMIKDAKNRGCTNYDFIGVLTTNKDSSEYGVYLFKYGFASKFVELIGEFDAVVDPMQYTLSKLMIKVNKVIRRPLILFLKKLGR